MKENFVFSSDVPTECLSAPTYFSPWGVGICISIPQKLMYFWRSVKETNKQKIASHLHTISLQTLALMKPAFPRMHIPRQETSCLIQNSECVAAAWIFHIYKDAPELFFSQGNLSLLYSYYNFNEAFKCFTFENIVPLSN